ncbi:hypothetical protein [Citrobacter pasteurii]|nr:hypothetical protein [Citrobacter pasteurii]
MWVRVEYRHDISRFLGCKPFIITYAEMLVRLGVHIPAAEQSIIIQD